MHFVHTRRIDPFHMSLKPDSCCSLTRSICFLNRTAIAVTYGIYRFVFLMETFCSLWATKWMLKCRVILVFKGLVNKKTKQAQDSQITSTCPSKLRNSAVIRVTFGQLSGWGQAADNFQNLFTRSLWHPLIWINLVSRKINRSQETASSKIFFYTSPLYFSALINPLFSHQFLYPPVCARSQIFTDPWRSFVLLKFRTPLSCEV
jgi:hypothetical protein